MVSHNDSTGSDQHPLHDNISDLLRGFYEGYSLGKNHLGEDYPKREREADSYGGDSLWGQINALIGQGWTWDRIMWGTSWANIMLTMIDAHRTDYKSDKKGREDNRQPDVLDLSDPANIEKLIKLAR